MLVQIPISGDPRPVHELLGGQNGVIFVDSRQRRIDQYSSDKNREKEQDEIPPPFPALDGDIMSSKFSQELPFQPQHAK